MRAEAAARRRSPATRRARAWLLAAVVAAAIAGCGVIQPARMALPAGVEARTDRVAIEGAGGAQRGSVRVGADSASFSRTATRLSFFDDLVATDRARVEYTLSGPGITMPVQARCSMKQRTVTAGIVSFDAKPLAFECEYTSAGRPIDARLELFEERRATSAASGMARRAGTMRLDGLELALRSVHEVDGSPIPLAAPIGYRFETGGAPVGAVEVNGDPAVAFLPAGGDPRARRAVLLASLALALLWDPANR